MKLQADIHGQISSVEIKRNERQVLAAIDGREYELEVGEPEPGVYLLKHVGRVFETYAVDGQVRIGGRSYEIGIIDPRRLRTAGAGGDHSSCLAEIKTSMPGKVVRILVDPGAEIAKGDGVLVVEAMKMQNELKAPKAGIVKEIRTEAGDTVSAGDILATIE